MRSIDNIAAIVEGNPYLTRYELARLFGVYVSAITANIKSIINSGIVIPDYDGPLEQVGKTLLPEKFGLEMIIALAFRFDSPDAQQIRKFILKRVASKSRSVTPQILVSCKPSSTIN